MAPPRRLQAHGHSRPADHATLTVAKRACRTADRLDPTRVPRPCRGVGGTAPPPSVGELRRLLQWGAHAPRTRQGYAAPSTCADSRAYRISHLARRSPSVLRSDGIIGRRRGRERDSGWIRTRPAPADPTSIATWHDEAIAHIAIALRLITLAFGPASIRNRWFESSSLQQRVRKLL